MGVKIKICGMKYPENMEEIALLQPDYLGFIFYTKSPRYFENTIPYSNKSIKKVGVFVNESINTVIDTAKEWELDMVQLHGDETPEFCKEINIDFPENITRIKASTEKRYFHFYSKDKKITLTCSSLGNYVHYFGITGEYNAILYAYEIFNKRATHTELCWGGRDYI